MDLASTGYSPAKKKGGRHIRSAGISPRNLDEVMEYEPSENVPDINDHVFDENNEDKDDDNDDEVITGLEVDTVWSRPCLRDLQGLGWAAIDKVKVKEVRQHAKDHLSWKSDMMNYIVLQVIGMKSISGEISVREEEGVEVEPIWTDYLTELQPNYYD